MISNQLGRRNLNPNQIAYLRGKRYECEKKIWGGDRKSEEVKKSKPHNEELINSKDNSTSSRVAKDCGVGSSTIERNARFSKVVDVLPKDVKDNVLIGNEKITHREVETILKMDKPTQKRFIKEVEQGTPIKEAIQEGQEQISV